MAKYRFFGDEILTTKKYRYEYYPPKRSDCKSLDEAYPPGNAKLKRLLDGAAGYLARKRLPAS